MKERPILFSGPMVVAILAGLKTQTRRIFKFRETGQPPTCPDKFDPACVTQPCPYGTPGDRLWVRETTQMRYLRNLLTGEPTEAKCGEYCADGEPVLNEHEFDFAWWYSRKVCPAIHMPRWASRITLEITDVRVERLQDISEQDAVAEGIVNDAGAAHRQRERFGERADETDTNFWTYDPAIQTKCGGWWMSATAAFGALWEKVNGPGAWERNLWVWVLTFRRV